MLCKLWAFDKKKNSTKLPTDAGTQFDGEIKHDFAVTSPDITFNFGTQLYTPVYNYCYVPNLRRYYFITNWYYSAGLWIASLAVDVLATYKTDIGNSRQYVTRAYSQYDPSIIDTAYLTKGDGIIRMNDLLTPTTFWGASSWGNNGTVVIGVVGANAGAMGAVTYYAMQMSTFGAFMQSMLTGISWAGISASEISEELQKALINPTQYIVSCRWFPILYSGFGQGTYTTQLKLGWWTFSIGSARILNTVSSAWVSRTSELRIPHHPQSSNPRLAYVDMSPYSTYTFKFLPFGVFNIDSTELFGKTYLGVNVETNLMTGDAVLKLSAKGPVESYNFDSAFLVAESQVGVTIPVGQISADVGKYKNALLAGGASALSDLIGG